LTALAVAVVPVLEDKATEAGTPPPPSPFRAALRKDGWKWLLGEVAVMVVLGLASMALDARRLRRLQKPGAGATNVGRGAQSAEREDNDPVRSAPHTPRSTEEVPHEQRREEDRGPAPPDQPS